MLMPASIPLGELENAAEFVARHIGPHVDDEAAMLAAIGATSRQALIETLVPRSIARLRPPVWRSMWKALTFQNSFGPES